MKPFKYNTQLNPLYWEDKKFNENIKNKLITIAEDFAESISFEIPIADIRLTGSIANFNYNSFSDLDVHIVVDFKQINNDVDLVREALNDKRFIWNLKHDIYIKGHEVELYFEDINEEHTSTGIYSLYNDEWIVEPEFNPPEEVNEEFINKKISYYEDLIDRMYNRLQKTKNKKVAKLIYNRAGLLKDKIMKVRKEALKKEGEFASENLIFKNLRNNNYIEKLLDILNHSYDKFFEEGLVFDKIVSVLS